MVIPMSEVHTAVDKDTFPASQFEDAEQQYVTATLGMWSFLITEIMFIGAVFAAFFVYRFRWHEAFVHGAEELKWMLGTINTVVLLTSSYTMVLAVHAARHGAQKALVRWLVLTFILGCAFVAIKGTEYHIEYKEHLVPGLNYTEISHTGEVRPVQMKLFMGFYFAMTAVHALHMLVGLAVLGALIVFAKRGSFTAAYNNPIDMFGLYWHFVDLVWVFLFPTLYLLRH